MTVIIEKIASFFANAQTKMNISREKVLPTAQKLFQILKMKTPFRDKKRIIEKVTFALFYLIRHFVLHE